MLVFEYCEAPHYVEHFLAVYVFMIALEETRQLFRSGKQCDKEMFKIYISELWNCIDIAIILSFLGAYLYRSVAFEWSLSIGLMSNCPIDFTHDSRIMGLKMVYFFSFFMVCLRLLNGFTILQTFGPLRA